MSLKDVQNAILSQKESSFTKTGMQKSLEENARKHYRMANMFVRSKNYSNAFFMYFASFQEYSQLYVSKKMNVTLEPGEALEFLAKSNRFSLTREELEQVIAKKAEVSMRKKMERHDCELIKKYVMSIRKAL